MPAAAVTFVGVESTSAAEDNGDANGDAPPPADAAYVVQVLNELRDSARESPSVDSAKRRKASKTIKWAEKRMLSLNRKKLDAELGRDEAELRASSSERAAQKSRRALKLAACVAAVALLFLGISIGTNAAVMAYLVDAAKETHAASSGTLLVRGTNTTVRVASADYSLKDHTLMEASGATVRTAVAEVKLPLYVLPVVPREQIESMRAVTVQIFEPAFKNFVEETLIITGVTRCVRQARTYQPPRAPCPPPRTLRLAPVSSPALRPRPSTSRLSPCMLF